MMKTQSEINKRLADYVKGTVNSPYRVTKPTSYDNRFGVMEVGAIDVDKSFHAQCADLAIDYVLWLTDNQTRLWGNARDIPSNKFPSGWKIIKNEKNTIAKKGWIAVFTTGSYSEYGHVGIVFETGDTNNYVILDKIA